MSEQEEEENNLHQHNHINNNNNNIGNSFPPKSSLMDLDLVDLDSQWPLDQLSFVSNPMSPFLISSSKQPCSPLWVFSDGDDEKCLGNDFPPNLTAAALRFPDYPRFLSLMSNPASKIVKENEDRKKLPPILSGITSMDTDLSCEIKERMTKALRYFKDSTKQHVLAQVWAPVKNKGRFMLTTSGQPFVLDPHCSGLNQYRMVSLMYMFSVDGDNDRELGLPGRVFQQKLPEWTPNVKYYSSREYSRLDRALQYNVQGTLALPVFEHSGQACVGVLELILTSQKIHYAPDVDKVCKALEAVNLRSSEILEHPMMQICNEGRHNALAEILEILTIVCETHKLPLAQTWVPCRHRSVLAYGGGLKKSCSSFDGSCMGQVCMSTSDVAFYLVDGPTWGFREACAEHHLQAGQGVVGKAFASHNSSFCSDITQFSKTEYPLVHYARLFGLTSCFAICLRSTHTGNDDYILEFFLPPSITEAEDQQILLQNLSGTMKDHFRSLKIVTREELEDEKLIEIIKIAKDEKADSRIDSINMLQSANSFLRREILPNGERLLHRESMARQLKVEHESSNDKKSVLAISGTKKPASSSVNKQAKETSKKKRGKAEKSISLDVLQQYFAGSLKDAAKSLGDELIQVPDLVLSSTHYISKGLAIRQADQCLCTFKRLCGWWAFMKAKIIPANVSLVCPTTMKRICRQHGISRWPSRKINKVNRSLTKLKRVIESVQGTDGTFGITSLGTSPLPVGSIYSLPPGYDSNQPTSPPVKTSEPHRGNIASPSSKLPGSDPLESAKCSNKSKSRSGGSREVSAGSPTSLASYHGSRPANQTTLNSLELTNQRTGELNLSAVYSIPNPLVSVEPPESFAAMLVEDVGSAKDLKNLCSSATDAFLEDGLQEFMCKNPLFPDFSPKQPLPRVTNTNHNFSTRQEMTTVTIKATYREDIIRFRFPLNSGIFELKEEVAKRLKLEVGTFDINYFDDDHEWVLIACDADLQECLDIAKSSSSNMVRLAIHEIMANLGSSCESTGG